MTHLAALRAARRRIDIPALCRSRHEHRSRGRTGLPQRQPSPAYRVGVARRLHAQQRVRIQLFVGRSMFEPHLLQVHLQLFGDQHRDGGVGALPHLDIGHGQDNLPIAADAHEGVGRKRRACDTFGCISSPDRRTCREADEEASAHGRAHTQEVATERSTPARSTTSTTRSRCHLRPPSCRSPDLAPRA